jgi:hypothetical protein
MMAGLIAKALSFIMPYKLIAIGLAILSVVVFIDRRATYKERSKCDAAALRAELAATKRDLNIQRDVADLVRKQAAVIEQEKSDLDKKVIEYEMELAKRPSAAGCRIGPDDLKRLRGIQ